MLLEPHCISQLCAGMQLGLHTCGLTVSCSSTGLKISAPPIPWRTRSSCQRGSLLDSGNSAPAHSCSSSICSSSLP